MPEIDYSELAKLVREIRWASVSLYDAEDKHDLQVGTKEWANRWTTLGLSIERLVELVSTLSHA